MNLQQTNHITLFPKNAAATKDFLLKINGRHSMTAHELIQIDDLCTTLVVDPLLRIKSHKMLLDYEAPSIQTHMLSLSIMLNFVNDGNILKAYRSLCSLKVTKALLKSQPPLFCQHFRDHLLRFLAMFRHDSGYTISNCSRYGHEEYVGAKLISTKYWRKGDVIEMLIGVTANLTDDEEKELIVSNKNDFSVLMSQRKMRTQLWLGPGAFLNHNCEPNCEFSSNITNTAKIIVLHDIKPGEELFINYGPEFFGDDNSECECQTCEK
jgi:histone-lysine N-methyltransferase SUV420H